MRAPRRRRSGAAPRGVVLGLALGVAACGSAPPPQRVTMVVFGGETSLDLRGVDAARAAAAAAEVNARLGEFERDWHPWKPGALMDLNAAFARGDAGQPPASLRDLILRSQPLSARSDGLFDPGVGGLLTLWGFHTDEFPITAPLPDRGELERWRERRPGIHDVHVEGSRVYSDDTDVQLDFGAIAEGVAAEEAARILAAHGIEHALIALGGDILALGTADGRAWRVGIHDPYGGVLAGVELGAGEALFSSGNYNKFREAPSGARWSHVLDPRTGEPARGTAAVAVLHRDPVLADVASTALMVGGPARFAELLQRLGVRCALLLTEENELMITAAMDARVQMQRDPVRLGAPLGLAVPCTP